MNILAVYSKTPKGIRKRSAVIISLLSPLQSRVLAQIDGKSNVKTILNKFDNVSFDDFERALNALLENGYIRLITISQAEWIPTENFTPMIIEEFSDFDEVSAKEQEKEKKQAELKEKEKAEAARAKAEAKVKARLEAERLEAERKAREEAEQKAREEAARKAKQEAEERERIEAEERLKAETKRLEEERLAREAEEARLKEEAERKAKEETERLAAEKKAKEEAKQEAEAKAKAEAEERARVEIERITREAKEAQLKKEAEKKAKEEAKRLAAEQKAKEEAELKAKQEAEAKAKAEAEEKERIEAEEQAKAEAKRLEEERLAREAEEVRLKEEAERKAKEEAELQEAERKAKQAAEEMALMDEETRAKAAAEEMARLEIERMGRELDEAKQRVETEKKTKKEAKRLAAEQKAREKAEEKARIEAEEASKQAAHEHEEDEKKRLAEEKAKQAEKLQALIRAEQRQEIAHLKKLDEERALQRALKEEVIVLDDDWQDADEDMQEVSDDEEQVPPKEHIEPPALDSAMEEMVEDDGFQATGQEAEPLAQVSDVDEEDQKRLEILKRAAAAELLEKSKLKLRERKKAIFRKANRILALIANRATRTIKTSFLIGILLLFVALGMLPYLPLNGLVAPFEQLAQEQLGTTVKIHKVSASLLPQPHFVLKDVEIGNDGHQAGQVHVRPEISSLTKELKIVKSLEIRDAKVTQENFEQISTWLNALGDSSKLKVESIHLERVVVSVHDFDIGEFDGEVVQTPDHKVLHIQLDSTDNKLHMQLIPQDNNAVIKLEADGWVLPLQNQIKFGKLTATGLANQNRLQFNQIKGDLFDGELSGNAVVDWSNQWVASANFSLSNASAASVSQAFGSQISVDGKLNWKGDLNSHAAQATQLAANTRMSTNFDIGRGQIEGLDIAHAVMAKNNPSLASGSTRFDSLRGALQISNQQYQLRNLVLSSKQLHASGNLTIATDGEISGKINANLNTQARRYSTNAGLTGRGSDIKLH